MACFLLLLLIIDTTPSSTLYGLVLLFFLPRVLRTLFGILITWNSHGCLAFALVRRCMARKVFFVACAAIPHCQSAGDSKRWERVSAIAFWKSTAGQAIGSSQCASPDRVLNEHYLLRILDKFVLVWHAVVNCYVLFPFPGTILTQHENGDSTTDI